MTFVVYCFFGIFCCFGSTPTIFINGPEDFMTKYVGEPDEELKRMPHSKSLDSLGARQVSSYNTSSLTTPVERQKSFSLTPTTPLEDYLEGVTFRISSAILKKEEETKRFQIQLLEEEIFQILTEEIKFFLNFIKFSYMINNSHLIKFSIDLDCKKFNQSMESYISEKIQQILDSCMI